jgi:hypothetical protein
MHDVLKKLEGGEARNNMGFACSGFFAYRSASKRARIVAGSVAENIQTKPCS